MSQNESHDIAGDERYNETNKILSNFDYTPIYIAITICSVILSVLLIINVVCCCSRFFRYWLERTGNLWIVPEWSAPHKLPVEYTFLENQFQYVQYMHPLVNTKYIAIHKKVPASVSRHPLTACINK